MNPHFIHFLDGLPPYELKEGLKRMNYGVMPIGNRISDGYAAGRKNDMIPAGHNGGRTDESCSCLIEFPATRYLITQTAGKAASRYILASKHTIGKDDTWRTERRNFNFRTHIKLKRLRRRTICFSKNEKIMATSSAWHINTYYLR